VEEIMKTRWMPWTPALILGLGALFTVGMDGQREMELRAPLDVTVPSEIAGQKARDVEVSKAERRVAGMSSYVMRVYSHDAGEVDQTTAAFSVYVGYYTSQTRGRTIHSPKNCLPGSGWEALTSTPVALQTPGGPVIVNRYTLQRGQQKAVVLYWYQGRGRIESNEYKVKWHLLRDAAIKRRSDEALVRIVVPAKVSEDEAFRMAAQVAQTLVPAVDKALPHRSS
jgi:EpsI family protein